jgi:hypothetical protein
MKSNRRSVLIGLGALTVGGGAVFGTGAFSTVEADRSVTVNIDGDSAGLIALNPDGDGATSDVVQLVNGLLEINFDAAASGSQGVNLDAETFVGDITASTSVDTNALTITNNGSNTVDISFTISFDSAHSGLTAGNEDQVLKLWTDTSGATATSGINGGDFGNLVANSLTLASGDTANIALEIDTVGLTTADVDTSAPLFETTATITATSQ